MNKDLSGIKFILYASISIFLGLFIYDVFKNLSLGIISLLGDLTLALLLSLIAFYLLDPLVTFLESYGISRGLSTIVVFLLLAAFSVLILVIVLPYVISESKNLKGLDLSRYMDQLTILGNTIQAKINKFLPSKAELNIGDKLTDFFSGIVKNIINITTSIIPQLIGLALTVPFFSFFFIRDGSNFRNWLIDLVPNKYFETALDLLYNINYQMGAFIRSKFIESLIIAVSTFLVLFPTGIKYNLLLSIFAGLCNLIPYIGPIIGAVPILIVAMADLQSTKAILYVMGAYLIFVQVIVDNILVIPLLIAKVSDLHPFTVLIAIIAGGKFLGVIGMFIAVPIASIIKIITEEIYYYYKFYGEKPLIESELNIKD